MEIIIFENEKDQLLIMIKTWWLHCGHCYFFDMEIISVAILKILIKPIELMKLAIL